MTKAILQNINIYPIKSSAGIELSSSWVEEFGLAFDRRFVVADLNGEFLTARTQPTLCLIQANLTASGLILTAPDMPALLISYNQLTSKYVPVNVWDNSINAQQCNADINKWFTQYLRRPCQLLFFGAKSHRLVKNRNTQVGFADGYPLLLISRASLEHLNSHYPADETAISMAQFRPNIVVNNCDAFAEDTWQHIRIGEVEFEITKSCTRCIFTTINPQTGEKHPQQEPLKTLMNYRQLESGDVVFGQNLVALNQGQIKHGDQVEVLQQKAPPILTKKTQIKITKPAFDKIGATDEPVAIVKKAKPSLTFSSFNKTIQGNSKQTILEQGEEAGLVLPYSCRAGMCGRCKVELLEGEVEQHCKDGLSDDEQQQNFILSCSCTPITDVVLRHPERKRRNVSHN
jgi:uncharacterized protein YcbX/ferredoxin